MSQEPNPARVVLGGFLLVAGICFSLLGGGCAINVLGELGSRHSGELNLSGLILTISLLTLAIGGVMIWGGVKLRKPRDE